MSIVIEDFYCLSCSSARCTHHNAVKEIVDDKTGLSFKIVCVCPHPDIKKKERSHKIGGNVNCLVCHIKKDPIILILFSLSQKHFLGYIMIRQLSASKKMQYLPILYKRPKSMCLYYKESFEQLEMPFLSI